MFLPHLFPPKLLMGPVFDALLRKLLGFPVEIGWSGSGLEPRVETSFGRHGHLFQMWVNKNVGPCSEFPPHGNPLEVLLTFIFLYRFVFGSHLHTPWKFIILRSKLTSSFMGVRSRECVISRK